ncbi:MAG: 5'-nucleotidase, lipoprotein e(P4) family [Balneolaceae bacterium]|nr:5'-nucleotidase, lipoprotein e(P4) family [Balneolaceae bacterium]
MNKLQQLLVIVMATVFASCSSVNTLRNPTTQATLWVQNSAEYEAITTQIYVTALRMLPLAKEDSYWTAYPEQENTDYSNLPPAIILDVDETILDNAPFQARMIKQGKSYNTEDWNQWASEAKADAIAGALEFTQYADKEDIQLFYITNREHDVENPTRKNLEDLGFPVSGGIDNILTKGERENWTSAKTERRKFVARNYRILMVFGDDLNDFIPAKYISGQERSHLVRDYSAYFGRRWFILPNPVYGSWERAMYDFKDELSSKEQKQIKINRLDTKNEEEN